MSSVAQSELLKALSDFRWKSREEERKRMRMFLNRMTKESYKLLCFGQTKPPSTCYRQSPEKDTLSDLLLDVGSDVKR